MATRDPADPHDRFRNRRPDFLVISPPKTGSTWLAAHLRRHPDLFVPEIKEVKYFSSLYKRLDFDWYCDHFTAAGARRAGEASPSYAGLPLDQIRRLRELLPDVRLVFLMREPVARAWSHAKHNHRYREANFAGAECDFASVSDDRWRANFAHDWPLTGGDYLGQLRRWSEVFPREQMFVGFYESIATRPVELLREVFAFLGVNPGVDLNANALGERVLEGPPGALPERLAPSLRGLLQNRTTELVHFLRDRFELDVPVEWCESLACPAEPSAGSPAAFRAGDEHLAAVLAQEEVFATGYRPILPGYREWDVVFCRGGLFAVERPGDPAVLLDDETRSRMLAEGACLTAPTLHELKEHITTRRLQAAELRAAASERELIAAREDTARLRAQVSGHSAHVSMLSAQVAELTALARRPSLARRALGRIRAVSGRTVPKWG